MHSAGPETEITVMSTTAAPPPEKRKRLFFEEDLNKVSRVIPNEGVSLKNDCLSSSQVSVTSVVEFLGRG